MVYKFSDALNLNYQQLHKFLMNSEELTKEELIERCSGEIDYDLLQSVKELSFERMGRTKLGELYIV